MSAIPQGWTNSEKDLQRDYFWGVEGHGTAAALQCGLTNPEPIMIKTQESGGDAYVFKSNGDIYLWNMIVGDVYKYVTPSTLEDILTEINKADSGNITMELVIED